MSEVRVNGQVEGASALPAQLVLALIRGVVIHNVLCLRLRHR